MGGRQKVRIEEENKSVSGRAEAVEAGGVEFGVGKG